MSTIKQPSRTPEQWMEIITEARQSGLTDVEWCRRNGMSRHTFYNAIRRLRKRACRIPERITSSPLDLTSTNPIKQDVVKIDLIGLPEKVNSCVEAPPRLLEHHVEPVISISTDHSTINISNTADPMLVSKFISALEGVL